MRVAETEVYRVWINGLRDTVGRARVQVRVDRLVHGNPGQHRNLTGGVSELKIDFGPGYRRLLHAAGNTPDPAVRRRRQVFTGA